MLKYFLCLSLFVLLEGCAFLSRAREQNLYHVRVGQTKKQLRAILGDPDDRDRVGREEKWHYDIYSNDGAKSYPYTARFVKGKLAAWYFDTARINRDGHANKERAPVKSR